MYILSEGISWYNKFGYISKNFEEEKEYNKNIIQKELLEYMPLLNFDEGIKLTIEYY